MGQDPWRQSADRFYSRETRTKQTPGHYRVFARAYRRLGDLVAMSSQSALLDVGCGCGELVGALQGQIGRYCGIDICRESLFVARKRNPDGCFICADMTAVPLSAKFDVAVAMTSLEFCFDKLRALGEIERMLCDSGQLYLEVRNGDFVVLKILAPFAECLKSWGWLVPYEAEGFRDLGFEEWRELLTRAGFQIVRLGRSLRPANYGGAMTRIKNLVIKIVALLAPTRWHYMVGFACIKR